MRSNTVDRRRRHDRRQALRHDSSNAAGGKRTAVQCDGTVGFLIGPTRGSRHAGLPMTAGRNFDEVLRCSIPCSSLRSIPSQRGNWKPGQDVSSRCRFR